MNLIVAKKIEDIEKIKQYQKYKEIYYKSLQLEIKDFEKKINYLNDKKELIEIEINKPQKSE